MDGDDGDELRACKLRIQELEALVASLRSETEVLESQNRALRQSLHVLETQRSQTEQGAHISSHNDADNNAALPSTTRANRDKGCLSHYPRRHVALKIMYLGARFHGFASDACKKRTVESELFAALEKTKLLIGQRAEANYSRCGRTDKGVSANGQIVALVLRSSQKDPAPSESVVPGNTEAAKEDRVVAARESRSQESYFAADSGCKEIDYPGVLNRALPPDIRVLGWCYVPKKFHARFSCMFREYRYFFFNDELDIQAMRIAASKFLGEHDFRNFCKMDADNVHNFKREIFEFNIVPCGCRWNESEIWMFHIKGTAFLWHQVRCMVAVLLMIGQQKESPSVVDELLSVQKTTRKPQYVMAPDSNLVLQSCQFQGLSFFCPAGTARLIHMHLKDLIKEHLVAAAMLQASYNQLPFNENSEFFRETKQKCVGHIPLLSRPTEPSYEERQRCKSQNKK